MKRFNTLRRTLLASALLAASGLASAQAVKLTLGHGAAPGNPRHEAAVKMAEVAKAKSNGRIEITWSKIAFSADARLRSWVQSQPSQASAASARSG